MTRESLDEPLLPTGVSAYVHCDRKPRPSRRTWHTGVPLTVSLILNILAVVHGFSCRNSTKQPEIYSPADNAIDYVQRRFTNLWDKSIYNGKPSPAMDDVWDALYQHGIMQLPEAEAAFLPNKTARIPGDEENYIFTFDVFHQLHCLNMIRQALHQEYYSDTYYAKKGPHHPLMSNVKGHEDFDHLGHCVDSIRESLTCCGDITPIVWAWDDQLKQTLPRLDVVHVCRDYGKIQEWADAHLLQTAFNSNVHLEDQM